ncbi:hypothetical protein L1987_32601 [Smallanthus sonchifolius]|uniref:Uncharacterized protein n=1 Tax=Smallanthus sonchifolius TaxID=185202 RepID=A0ACB9HQF3_9ASTR|nr:hypothetical protein L1987_32601 [Smallanthus sonchifolius]
MSNQDSGEIPAPKVDLQPDSSSPEPNASFSGLFYAADKWDFFLMLFGSLGACVHGAALPVFFVLFGRMIDSLGHLSAHPHSLSSEVTKNSLYLIYLGLVVFISSWIGVACWMQTGERQTAHLRFKYLQSMLRKDIKFFDTKDQNVLFHISSDAILVQDAIGDKNKAIDLYSRSLQKALKLTRKSGFAKGIGIGFTYALLFCAWVLLLWYAGILVRHHDTNGGKVFTTIINVIFSGFALGQAAPNLAAVAKGKAAAGNIVSMIKEDVATSRKSNTGMAFSKVHGNIEFREVWQVMLDCQDIKNLQLSWLRGLMGLVSQEPALFATTIAENILYGKPDADLNHIIQVSKAANAHSFIQQLPDSYHTQVGEGGTQLSGGQKQRIAIARATLRNPKILLLDDATSALDSQSELIVQQSLNTVMSNRTTIIVGHKLSTLRDVDTITVLKNGQVVENGTHLDLISKGGEYSNLVSLQTSQPTSTKVQTSVTQHSH